MKTVSENTHQNTNQKKKNHRFPSEISRKIVAFEVIANANQVQSVREINRLIDCFSRNYVFMFYDLVTIFGNLGR